MPVYMGSQRIKELYVGGQRIKSAHIWNGVAWQRVHVWPVAAPSRVNKSGDQLLSNSVWESVTGWTLAAGYQGQASSSGVKVVGSGTVNISSQIRVQYSNLSKQLQILRNGVAVGAEGSNSSGFTVSASASSVDVDDGDVISLTARLGGTTSSRTISEGSDTYIQITAT